MCHTSRRKKEKKERKKDSKKESNERKEKKKRRKKEPKKVPKKERNSCTKKTRFPSQLIGSLLAHRLVSETQQ